MKTKTKKAPSAKKTDVVASPAHALAAYYSGEVKAINKKLGLSGSTGKVLQPISTGLLCVDWVNSGGMHTIHTQVSGKEASGKSTLSMLTMASAVKMGVPIINYFDAEGSIDPRYADNVLSAFDVSKVFANGRVGYQTTTLIEEFGSFMAMLVDRLPDKVYSDDIGSWCYAVPKGDRNAAELIKALEGAGLKPDKKASDLTGRWMYPTAYDGPEAAIFVDSWPTFTTRMRQEKIVKGETGGAGMGMMARAFSLVLPDFVGSLKAKGVALMSVNQIREKIGVQYGDPEYETGGNALYHSTACRDRMYARAVPQGFTRDPNNGRVCIEPSVTGDGTDVYAFKAVNNVKHKLGRPFLKTMTRVWVSDRRGEARGFDPVFDTWNYLLTTGQVQGNFKKASLTLRTEGNRKVGEGLGQLSERSFDYPTFKQLIVAEHMRDRDLLVSACKKLKLNKPPRVRSWLFDQLRTDKSLWATDGAANTNDLAE